MVQWGIKMNTAKKPRSLRASVAKSSVIETFDNYSGRKVTAVAGLMAVARRFRVPKRRRRNLTCRR